MDAASRTGVRRRRSDGERTHAAIVEAAIALASVEGLDGLTIGRLAQELGVSKSGVYAHFGSKEVLERETIAAATAVFDREVIAPAMRAPDGLPRLRALAEAHLSYVERLVFPGGCFFASLLAEMDARSGPVADMVRRGVAEWQARLAALVARSRELGQITPEVDPRQIAFEVDACLELANYHYVLTRDADVLERARKAIDRILDAVAEGHGG